jgi:hypothetical protein
LGGSKKVHGNTHQTFYAKLQQNDPTNGFTMKIKTIVENVMSYDVLIGGAILYPMGFTLGVWKEIASYKLKCCGCSATYNCFKQIFQLTFLKMCYNLLMGDS